MSYETIAPTVKSVGYSATAVQTYFNKIAAKPESPALPELTKAKVKIVADCYYIDGIEAHNGFVGIARKARLHPRQVKKIIKELEAYRTYREQL